MNEHCNESELESRIAQLESEVQLLREALSALCQTVASMTRDECDHVCRFNYEED